QFLANFKGIVDLAVIHKYITSATGDHGLMAGRGEIYDRQPATRKRNSRHAVHPEPTVVRAPVPQGLIHRCTRFSERLLRRSRPLPETGDPAHRQCVPCGRTALPFLPPKNSGHRKSVGIIRSKKKLSIIGKAPMSILLHALGSPLCVAWSFSDHQL